MNNPWLNISINDTIADCDKALINSLPQRVLAKFEFRTLPEPFHGDPEANVYILHGNPLSGSRDLAYLGVPEYEKEMVEEMSLINKEFLWLREKETIIDNQGLPYPAYHYWKDATKTLRNKNEKLSLFCIEAFPYHSAKTGDFQSIKNLPSNLFTNEMVVDAINKEKYIVLMRCKDYWYNRVPQLKGYNKLLFRNSNRCPALSRNNLCTSLPTQSQWDDFVSKLHAIV